MLCPRRLAATMMFSDCVLDHGDSVSPASLVADAQLPDGAFAVSADAVSANVSVAISLSVLLASFDVHGDIRPVNCQPAERTSHILCQFAIFVATGREQNPWTHLRCCYSCPTFRRRDTRERARCRHP